MAKLGRTAPSPTLGLSMTCTVSAPQCLNFRFITSRYLGRLETYEGVMAQEVLQVMPDAVLVGTDGYYRVNYGALGTSMRQVSA